jgi:hypothetical protein
MEVYIEVEKSLNPFSITALDKSKLQTPTRNRLNPGKDPGTYSGGGDSVALRYRLKVSDK